MPILVDFKVLSLILVERVFYYKYWRKLQYYRLGCMASWTANCTGSPKPSPSTSGNTSLPMPQSLVHAFQTFSLCIYFTISPLKQLKPLCTSFPFISYLNLLLFTS